jgi:hypothetical protein
MDPSDRDMESRDPKRDRLGRFEPKRPDTERFNVEDLPRLPTRAALLVLRDPWRRPHLALWESRWGPDSEPAYMLRIELAGRDLVRLTGRLDDPGIHARVVARRGPGNLVNSLWQCPRCQRAGRFLYFHGRMGPRCRACAGLRFASEGRYMTVCSRALTQWFEGPVVERDPWNPVAIVPHPRLALAHFAGLTIAEAGEVSRS